MKKVFLFFVIFLVGAFFLGLILKKLDYGRVKSVKFSGSKIYDFTLVNKNHNKMYFNGKKAIETGKIIRIFYLDGYLEKNKNKTFISSKKALLKKLEKKLILEDNVSIKSKGITLTTGKIILDLDKNIAYGNDFCKIMTKNTLTTGKNIFINLKKEVLKLQKVKTIIER